MHHRLVDQARQLVSLATEEVRVRAHVNGRPRWGHPYYWAAFVLYGDVGE